MALSKTNAGKPPAKPRPRKTKPIAEVAAELGDFGDVKETQVTKPQVTPIASEPVSSDVLRIEYLPVHSVVLWDNNPKKHDETAIWGAIQEHGFKDPPKWEPKLNGGSGGIVEGNGRSHVLRDMALANETPPRGIKVDGNGVWYMPVVFGVDAKSESQAEAYGIDHNNISLLGGDFDDYDLSKLYDVKGYTELVARLSNEQQLPVSVDGDDVDALIRRMADEGKPKTSQSSSSASSSSGSEITAFEQTQHIEKSNAGTLSKFTVVIDCEDEGEQQTVYDALKEQYENIRTVST